MRKIMRPKIGSLIVLCGFALSVSSCSDSSATLHPALQTNGARTIAPKYTSLSDPIVRTDRSAKDYYLDLERCRSDVAATMGGGGSDDVAALRRALQSQSDPSSVVVHYGPTDLAVIRDRAVKRCLVRKGYDVKL